MPVKVIDLLSGRDWVYCEISQRFMKLRKARKKNQGGPVCENCPYRRPCNRSADSQETPQSVP